MKGKLVSAQLAGFAVAAIIVWLIGSFTKVVVPPEVAVAFGTLASVIVSLLVPDHMEAE